MEKIPKQKISKGWKEVEGSDIGYGPRLERVSDEVDLVSEDDFGQIESESEGGVVSSWEIPALSEKQRQKLRSTLFSIGVVLAPMKDTGQFEKVSTIEEKSPVQSHEIQYAPLSKQEQVAAFGLHEEEQSEPLDQFFTKVEEYRAQINPIDIESAEEFASKKVVGASEFNRKQYVQQEIKFTDWDEETGTGVPPVVQAELRRLMPGLSAKESGFNAALTSKAGAKGILQFMPETWAHYGGKPEEQKSLKRQVEIAGKFISDLYKQLNHHLGEEVLGVLRAQASDDESFQRDIMVPLVVNAYNVGAKRMAEAVQLYLERTPLESVPEGKDLYLAIAEFAKNSKEGRYLAGYQEQSFEYVLKIYALAEALSQRG